MTTGVVVQEELGREFPALASLDPASKELRSDASPWHLTLKGMESEPCAFAEWPLGSLSASESLMTQLGDEVDPRYVFLGEQGTAFAPFHASRHWVIALIEFDTLDDLQQACKKVQPSPGMGLHVWSLVDAPSCRWTAVIVCGMLHASEAARLPVPATGVEVFSLCFAEGFVMRGTPRCVYVLPWYDYGKWWGCHRRLLDVSEWQWSVGEKIQALEYRWYTDLDVGTRLICTDENCALEAGWL